LNLNSAYAHLKLGVLREFQATKYKPIEEKWIRAVYQDPNEKDYFIICCTYAQAIAFSKMRCIEMDLSFKNVAGTIKLFSLVGWNDGTFSEYTLGIC
jgi:hypothetical protein